jgi:hypothetical protein
MTTQYTNEELLKLSEAASTGPYMHDFDDYPGSQKLGRRVRIVVTGRTIMQMYYHDEQGQKDAAYIIAACNEVPRLVRDYEHIDKQNDALLDQYASACKEIGELRTERDVLKAELEQAEQAAGNARNAVMEELEKLCDEYFYATSVQARIKLELERSIK